MGRVGRHKQTHIALAGSCILSKQRNFKNLLMLVWQVKDLVDPRFEPEILGNAQVLSIEASMTQGKL